MTDHAFPRFDPDSPDKLILEAFEQVRASRALIYSFDHMPDDQAPMPEIEAAQANAEEGEDRVHGDHATTPAGIMARLSLALVSSDQNRWVDHALMKHGLGALYQHRDALDGNTQQIMWAAIELLHLDWEAALSACEVAMEEHLHTISVQSATADVLRLLSEEAQDATAAKRLHYLVETQMERSNDVPALTRMIRTLTPSHEALARKLEIVATEHFEEGAAPWIARDVTFLAGLTVNIDQGEK